MIKIIVVVLSLFAVTSFASKAPFNKEINKALTNDNAEASGISRKFARVEYDVAVDGGGSTTSTKPLRVKLPAGAVVTSVLVYINTAFSSGSGTKSVALQCNSGARDLMDWQDLGALGANGVLFGGLIPTTANSLAMIKGGATPAPAQSGVVSVPTACTITALVRKDAGYTDIAAGKFTAIIEYFNKN